MPLQYNKIAVIIDGKYLLAESVSLDQISEQKPLYFLNNNLPYDNSPTVFKSSININYYIEPENDPNFSLITSWKNDMINNNLIGLINIGGCIFYGYLNNYSFEVIPNQPIKARSSYLSFYEITSNIVNWNVKFVGNSFNLRKGTGIAHYYTTSFTSGAGFVPINDNNILQLTYSFNSNILPSYTLGNSYPTQVSVLDATEEINVVNESQLNLKFIGLNYQSIFNTIDNIKISNLSSMWGDVNRNINFSLSGFEIQSNKIDISNENIIIFNHNLKKYY